MKHQGIMAALPSALIVFGAGLIFSTASFAQPGGPGGPGGAGGSAGPTADIAALEADLAALQLEVQANTESIAALGVNTVDVDCAADAGALQAAIDAAPAAGAIFNVSGVCAATNVIGRTNLLIDGGAIGSGNGIGGTLHVDASRNVQLSGLTVDDTLALSALSVENNSSVFVDGDVNVLGSLGTNVNSSLLQLSGTLNVSGEVTAFQSGQVSVNNGSFGGVTISRSSSFIANTNGSGGSNTVAINGNLGTYSGSNLLLQANVGNGGPVTYTGDLMFVQRVAAALLAGDNVVLDVDNIFVRQNGVLDVILMEAVDFGVGSLNLSLGSGSRAIFSDGGSVVADCDDSAWTNIAVSCAP